VEPVDKAECGGDDHKRKQSDQDVFRPVFHCSYPFTTTCQSVWARTPWKYALNQGCCEANIVSMVPASMLLPSPSTAIRSQARCRLSRSCVTISTEILSVCCSVRIS